MQAYYDYVAQNGGIDGRKIVITGKDDQYAPGRHEDELRRGAGGGQVRRVHAVLGTPNNLGIWDDTNRSACRSS